MHSVVSGFTSHLFIITGLRQVQVKTHTPSDTINTSLVSYCNCIPAGSNRTVYILQHAECVYALKLPAHGCTGTCVQVNLITNYYLSHRNHSCAIWWIALFNYPSQSMLH